MRRSTSPLTTYSIKVLAAAFILSGEAFADNCVAPAMPEVPEGATATLEEMIAGQKDVKTFQADAQAFRQCLEEQLSSLKAAAADGDDDAAAAFKTATDAYNGSVAAEEQVAGDFNTQIRAYKEANPS